MAPRAEHFARKLCEESGYFPSPLQCNKGHDAKTFLLIVYQIFLIVPSLSLSSTSFGVSLPPSSPGYSSSPSVSGHQIITLPLFPHRA